MDKVIYLDNAATTFPKPESVYRRVDYVQRNLAVNVGRGSYEVSKTAMSIVDETRDLIARLVHASCVKNVVFAPSATIALNQIILGLPWNQYKNVYITPFEHNGVLRPLELARVYHKFKVFQIPFNKTTYELDSEELKHMFTINPPDYVFISHLSNVIGLITPVYEISAIARQYGALIVLDASQSIGLIDIDLRSIGVDFLVFAGHKNLYSAFGIGGFIRNCDVKLVPRFAGGTGSDSLNLAMPSVEPQMFEFGSPNIIAIASLNESVKWVFETGLDKILKQKNELMRLLVLKLLAVPSIKMYLPSNLDSHISVLSINVNGYLANDVGSILNQDYNIAVRTGYHCAPYVHDFIESLDHQGTVRLSLGYFNIENDINAVVNALYEIQEVIS